MSKKDYYQIENNAQKIINGGYTNFLDPNIESRVISKLGKYPYKIYSPYTDSEKVIIYTDKLPEIKVLEIISYDKLTHREILGSLFGLNLDKSIFGDIIITNNKYYIIILSHIYNLLVNKYKNIGNHLIELKEVDKNIIANYQNTYEEITLIVSSLRIDTIVSKIVSLSREFIKKKFDNDEIILNYEVCHKLNYNLKPLDIFSIRKYGKYKYIGIIKDTRKGNYIIKCYKYMIIKG